MHAKLLNFIESSRQSYSKTKLQEKSYPIRYVFQYLFYDTSLIMDYLFSVSWRKNEFILQQQILIFYFQTEISVLMKAEQDKVKEGLQPSCLTPLMLCILLSSYMCIGICSLKWNLKDSLEILYTLPTFLKWKWHLALYSKKIHFWNSKH